MNRIEPWNETIDESSYCLYHSPRLVSSITSRGAHFNRNRPSLTFVIIITIVVQGSNGSRICCQTCHDTLGTHTLFSGIHRGRLAVLDQLFIVLVDVGGCMRRYAHHVTSSRMDSFANSNDKCILFDHMQPWVVGDGLTHEEEVDNNLQLEREHRQCSGGVGIVLLPPANKNL